MTSSRLLQIALCTLAPLPAVLAQQPPVQIQVPPLQQREPVITLHANSRAVLLDVVVTDGHGRAVHNLKPEDFHLTEDGQPQNFASFEEHHANPAGSLPPEPPPPPLPANTFTNRNPPVTGKTAATVFLLDAVDSPLTAQMYARDQILAWIDSKPADAEVAIFQFGTQMHLIQGFTADPVAIRTAVTKRYKPMLTALPHGNGYVAQSFQMDSLTSAMQSLGAYLATRPGRKNLIWFTAHVPRAVYDGGSSMGGSLQDGEGFVFDYSKATEALSLGEVSIYPIDTRGLQTDPTFSASHSGLPSKSSNFGTEQFFQHSDLDAVAEATGGRAFYNTNGIKQVISEVIDAGSNYYTLSYYPSNKEWDGGYRKLKLATSETGLQLEYRRGYYAVANAPVRQQSTPPPPTTYRPDPYGRVQLTHHNPTPDQAAFFHAMHLAAVDPNQIVFTARVNVDPTVDKVGKKQPLPKDNFLEAKYKDRPFRVFNVFSRLSGNQLQLTQQPGGTYKGSIESAAFVLDDQGVIVNSIITSIDMNLTPASYAQAIASGVELLSPIAVPEKGTYFLRVGVHDKSTGRAGALEFSSSDVKIALPAPTPPGSTSP